MTNVYGFASSAVAFRLAANQPSSIFGGRRTTSAAQPATEPTREPEKTLSFKGFNLEGSNAGAAMHQHVSEPGRGSLLK